MSELEQLLDEFKSEMLKKFWARAEKQHRLSGRSVTDDDFDWSDMPLDEIEAHFREEIAERFEDGADKAAEDIDIANLSFIDWAARRHAPKVQIPMALRKNATVKREVRI